MSDQVSQPPNGTQEQNADTRSWYAKKRFLLPIVAVVAFLFGTGVGASSEDVQEAASSEGQATDAAEMLAALEEREALLDERAAELEEREAALEDETEPEPEPEPEEQEVTEGVLTAGRYEFNDVQVTGDGLGDFQLRTRVTNTGEDVSGVIWTATVFKDNSVIATLQATAQDFASGSTQTVEFVSMDTYDPDFDEVEFQVDTEL